MPVSPQQERSGATTLPVLTHRPNAPNADKLNEKLTEVQKLSAQIITLQRQKDECQKHVDAARQAFNSADRVLNELKNNIVNYESLTANEKENIRATMNGRTPPSPLLTA